MQQKAGNWQPSWFLAAILIFLSDCLTLGPKLLPSPLPSNWYWKRNFCIKLKWLTAWASHYNLKPNHIPNHNPKLNPILSTVPSALYCIFRNASLGLTVYKMAAASSVLYSSVVHYLKWKRRQWYHLRNATLDINVMLEMCYAISMSFGIHQSQM